MYWVNTLKWVDSILENSPITSIFWGFLKIGIIFNFPSSFELMIFIKTRLKIFLVFKAAHKIDYILKKSVVTKNFWSFLAFLRLTDVRDDLCKIGAGLQGPCQQFWLMSSHLLVGFTVFGRNWWVPLPINENRWVPRNPGTPVDKATGLQILMLYKWLFQHSKS